MKIHGVADAVDNMPNSNALCWSDVRPSPDCSHHVDQRGEPVYRERFSEVLKFHAPGLAPVLRDDEAWHIRTDGSQAYPHRFKRTFGFYEGLAAVNGDDGWHHILPDGQPVYRERYVWCGNFQGGRCTVRRMDGTYIHIKQSGEPAYQSHWRYVGDYRDGVAVVQGADGRSTHIDVAGEFLHECWFIDLDVFHKGFARARDEDGWTHVDTSGQPIFSRRFAAVEPFYNGQARVERFDGALEVIDESGLMVVELRPPRRSEFAELSGDMVGFWKTQTISAAVQLGVIEALPGDETHIAQRCGLKIDGARRLLRALCELKLLVAQEGGWALSPRGEFLHAGHSLTLADAALEYAGPFSIMWGDLAAALQADSAWRSPDVFGDVARDDCRRGGHHRMLQSYARHDYVDLVDALELDPEAHIIDAGGGLGELARLVLKSHPSATVTVLDLPEVVALGKGQTTDKNLIWHGVDFFTPWGLTADVVLLSRILHDWDDEAAVGILTQTRSVLPRGGRVLLIEMLLKEDSVAGSLCDLHLLMVTGGRERSIKDFERLLYATGFKLEVVRTTAALPSIIVGVAQ